MKVRNTDTNEEYDVVALADLTTEPNPEVEGDVLVETVNPSGETVTMSVHGESPVAFLQDTSGNLTIAGLEGALPDYFETVED